MKRSRRSIKSEQDFSTPPVPSGTSPDDAGAVKRFHQMKTEWGFDQLLLLESFKDASNGYLVNDSCTFGAEVFVIEQKATRENLSMIKVPAPNPISFKIENFSKLDKTYYESPLQSIAGFNWKIGVSPSGQGPFKDKQLSLFLCLAEAPGVPPKKSFYVKYKLRLMDQISSYHKERTGQGWFKTDKSVPYRIGDKVGWTWGFRDFESLENLRNASKGFLVKDTLIVEADIVLVAKPIFSS
ncbi:hypothetical protein PTKIN_Ptkin15bG0018200 [Pterospermum kingtungense]